MVKFLVMNGADPSIKNNFDKTASQQGELLGRRDCLDVLKQAYDVEKARKETAEEPVEQPAEEPVEQPAERRGTQSRRRLWKKLWRTLQAKPQTSPRGAS